MNMTMECAESVCAVFNRNYPVGSQVTLVNDFGDTFETIVRAPAEARASAGGCVVFVEGIAGFYKLDRVVPGWAGE